MIWTVICLMNELPDPQHIRRTATEVVQGTDYHLESSEISGIWLYRWIEQIFRWLVAPFQRLFESIHAVSPVIAWLFIGLLILVLLVLVFHILYSIRNAVRMRADGRPFDHRETKNPTNPKILEQRSIEAAGAGDYILAIRLLFRAGVLRIEQAQKHALRRGVTNREILKRYQNTPIAEQLGLFVDMIDRKWYGDDVCIEMDYRNCSDAHATIRQFAVRSGHVDRT